MDCENITEEAMDDGGFPWEPLSMPFFSGPSTATVCQKFSKFIAHGHKLHINAYGVPPVTGCCCTACKGFRDGRDDT